LTAPSESEVSGSIVGRYLGTVESEVDLGVGKQTVKFVVLGL